MGRPAVRELVAAGHGVAGVTRSARGRQLLAGLGARAVAADVFDTAALTAAFAGADTVVNLLTHVPPARSMGEAGAWDENDRLRTEASAAIARAAGAAGAARLVQESITFMYADGGEAWLDEEAPLEPTGRWATAAVAEANAIELFPGATVVLRFGTFIGPDNGLTLTRIEDARAGISPSVGPRAAFQPTIWLDDAGAAVAAAMHAPAGRYNVADAEPATRGEIDAALAAAVGRPELRPALEVVPPGLEPLARSQRVSSRRLRDGTGWEPLVRGGTEGWQLMVGERRPA